MFQKVLREGLNRDVLDMHLNGDETVALGSAFRAANVSTAFKPRFVGMTDISPFSVGVELYRSVKESEAGSEEENEVKEEPVDPDTPMSDMKEEKKNHGTIRRIK